MFTGYSEKVGDFFWELRFNNSREWFNPRNEEFNQLVMQPTKEMCIRDRLFCFPVPLRWA